MLAVGTACGAAAGCGGGNALSAVTLRQSPPASPSASPSASAAHSHQVTADPDTVPSSAAACVTRVDDRLSLAQRVGQLFLVGTTDDIAGQDTQAAVRAYHFGSLLLPENSDGTASLAAADASIQALAASATHGVRFFIGTNQEGGEVQQLTGSGFVTIPSELEQGTWTATALRAQAATWGSDLRAAGVNLDLAPVMDVVPTATAAQNAPIGALDRQFGADPAGNGEHGAAFIEGMAKAGVDTVAKHFPGLGMVTGNTDDVSDVVDNVTTASDPDLGSFKDAVEADVPFVMVALATYTKIDPTRLAVFSPVVMRLLRDQFGFDGVIISDDLGDAIAVQSIAAGTRATDFLAAGGDVITSQSIAPAELMASAVLEKASDSASFRATVDAAARRVLAAKQANGLLSC